jgi:hypothetical protein
MPKTERHTPEQHEPQVDELLDLISDLVAFSRAGTFDAAPGELSVWRRANTLLARYRPEAESTS